MDLSELSKKQRRRPDDDSPLLRNSVSNSSACWWCPRVCHRMSMSARLGISLLVLCMIAGAVAVIVLTRDKTDNTPSRPSTKEWQQRYIKGVDNKSIRTHALYYGAQAHLAGTPRDRDTALYTQDRMLTYGIPDVQVETFNVLLSYPFSRSLSIVEPVAQSWNASLQEDPVDGDPWSALPAVPTFLAYSASGDVTAPLVYVNYGRREDFLALAAAGIDVRGKIAIVRYWNGYRGNKVEQAELAGAVGCIIFSDPKDDGSSRGQTYPTGPWRPKSGVQRGSIWTGNGDPLTPGWPSLDDAPRISMDDAFLPNKTFNAPLSKIPSLPISWQDASVLLRGMTGAEVPTDWRGGDFTYHYGPGPQMVRLNIRMNYTTQTIYNVLGKIPGAVEPDRIVILGNHRDAYTFGAGDPVSGSSSLLETANGLGQLYRAGWRPRRSIWLCSWDAEEFALTGSVEFVEKHFKKLYNQAIAYINIDTAVSGTPLLSIAGIPSLATFVRQVATSIPAPDPSHTVKTLMDLWRMADPSVDPPPLTAADMGTGSDFGPFIQHAGIPSLDLGFRSADHAFAGAYHSIYDNFQWMDKFGDRDFKYHGAMTQLVGSLSLMLSDTPLLPFSFVDYASQLVKAADKLSQRVGGKLNFAPLRSQLSTMVSQASSTDAEMANAVFQAKLNSNPLLLRAQNDKLHMAERSFLWLQGAPGREWTRHLIWATSALDGYGSGTFSTIEDAIAMEDWREGQRQIGLCAILVQQFVEYLGTPLV